MNKKFLLFFLFILMFAFLPDLFSQEMRDLRVGSFLEGELSGNDNHWFRLQAAQNGFLSLEITGELDTFMEVLNEQRVRLTIGDNWMEARNNKMELSIRAGNVYFIRLSMYGREAKPYRITSSFTPYTPLQLNIDSFRSGNIERKKEYWFYVQAAEDNTLIIETTGGTSTYLEIFTDKYEPISSSLRGGERRNARLEIPVRAGNIYIIMLRGEYDSTTGRFHIMAYHGKRQ
ncbi:MAG: hypothetical protein FWD14_05970 [Treponema sp.]|nr:hypothetical protein [Treponema sp.]